MASRQTIFKCSEVKNREVLVFGEALEDKIYKESGEIIQVLRLYENSGSTDDSKKFSQFRTQTKKLKDLSNLFSVFQTAVDKKIRIFMIYF